MDKEEVLREFYIQDKKEKEMMLEKFVFCHFSSEKDFENYFRIDELEEGELFRSISFSKRFYSRLERLNGDYVKEKQSQHESG